MNRDIIGYLLGLIIFIIAIPYVMFLAAGSPNLVEIGLIKWSILIVLAIVGIGLSVWSIVYMKNVGGGNPFDAFNHEIAPRTSSLMTEGPYGICRNPMLLGVFVYHIGVLIAILSVFIFWASLNKPSNPIAYVIIAFKLFIAFIVRILKLSK